ncbi:MAG: PilZ domain-containing protein [Myxococcota bacterium]
MQSWVRIQWLCTALAAVGPLLVPMADADASSVVIRGSVGLLVGLSVLFTMAWARHRSAEDLDLLRQGAERLGTDDEDRNVALVLPMRWDEFAPLGEAFERARGRMVMRLRLLRQQRDDLASHLSRTEERLRDPTTEDRRRRIARLDNLQARLTVGPRTSPAAVLDLSLEAAVLGVTPSQSGMLVPGLPVGLEVSVEETYVELPGTIVLAPARGGQLDLAEWVFQFDPPLKASMLPGNLATALELRRSMRIRPVASNPAGVTMVCALGRLPAEVVDISASGIGLKVDLDARRAGRLGPGFTIQLHLPTMGEVAILPVSLRNVAVRSDGVRLGVSYEPSCPEEELAKVAAWLDATRHLLSSPVSAPLRAIVR